ncbi:DUF177 domain-containing protein [Acuticoccus sp. MNP-M23]|uniref:YceD family protein n=1 Tax=Acuticoccus sp. MNP-M23 TaxID=3072793 RepID=UPI002814A521|nr:DUF177 domain-containing protein [Acuticoccus sp. MNP-M23]WMS43344.1 DUF177 domain-containing protein [Acuticoccus sp. MNP-M23]
MSARLSRPISVRRLNKEERVSVEATEEERTSIADALDLIAIHSFTADVILRPWKKEGVRVEGTVTADVVQPCIVTLDPVPSTVNEEFNIRLHPDAAPSAEVNVDPEAEDPPELLETEMVDVGAIVLEHFALGLDPYPRAPGAVFENEADEPEEEPSPFAVLEALKKQPN